MKQLLPFLIFTLIYTNTFSQENWMKDPSNPVLKRDTVFANLPNDIIAISDPWVIKEGAVYKMWYTCGGINYPTDEELRSRICYCESNDGKEWIKYAENPVLDVDYNGEWDSLGVETVSIIIDNSAIASERYKMWYAGQYFNNYRYDFGYAVSPDGKNWTKYPGTIMEVGNATDWDGGFIEGASVIKDGSTYKMWYAGYNLTNGDVNIGYATSTDGIAWNKYSGNPILSTTPMAWDSIYVQDPHVIKIGSNYHMWYGGVDQSDFYGQQTGYAFSLDGINWTKSANNPILFNGNTGDWDDNTASFPSVLFDGDTLKMWYTGKDVDPPPTNSTDYYWETGYATDMTNVLEILVIKNDKSISISPNPFYEKLNLKANVALNNSKVILFDLSGMEVFREVNISGNEVELNTIELENGTYFIFVLENEQIVFSDKVIFAPRK